MPGAIVAAAVAAVAKGVPAAILAGGFTSAVLGKMAMAFAISPAGGFVTVPRAGR